ncbi:MAG: DUF4364 family protein [Clostridia bacterium]|nr:DUF4364 family protein [Clostridia bacterium]
MSERYDALREGVEPGGMLNKNGIRLLVCYLLKSLDHPVSREVINGGLCGSGLANYFEVGSALGALCDKGLVAVSDGETETYTVTTEGAAVAAELERDLPRSVRRKAVESAAYFETAERRRRENSVTVRDSAGGYAVTLHAGRPADPLMDITVYVATEEQVDMMRASFMRNPEKLCEKVFNMLIESES